MGTTRNRNKPTAEEVEQLYAHIVAQAKPVWGQDVEGVAKLYGWPKERVRIGLRVLDGQKRIFRILRTYSLGSIARQQHEIHVHEGESKRFVDRIRTDIFLPTGAKEFFGRARSWKWPEGLERSGCPLCVATLETIQRQTTDDR